MKYDVSDLVLMRVIGMNGMMVLFNIDRRYGKDRTISDDILEHILWQVRDPQKITNFLHKLLQSHLETGLDDSKLGKDFIQTAHAKLKDWKKGPFVDEHPIVLLSLALERANCSPVDKTFFRGGFVVSIHLHAGHAFTFQTEIENTHPYILQIDYV